MTRTESRTRIRTRDISLPLLDDRGPAAPSTPIAPTPIDPFDFDPVPQIKAAPNPMLRRILDGEPFHSMKVLNHFDRLLAIARGETVFPVTVEIDPSNVCNHRCEWCVSELSHTGEVLRYERFEILVDELSGLETKSVVLKGGGEPTVHPRFVEMLYALRQRDLRIGLITNGSMPRKGAQDAILECVDWVRISLDAACAETHHAIHGTKDFGRIIGNVRYMTENSTHTLIGLNFVAEPRNCDQIAAFAAMGRDLGVGYVSIRCVFDPAAPLPEAAREGMREQARMAKQYETPDFRVMLGNFSNAYLNADPNAPFPFDRCLGPNMVGVVGADNEVYACCYLRGNRDFSFGNIEEQDFETIWRGDRRRKVMDAVYRGECDYICQGGTTANRYNIYNEILNYLAMERKEHADFA